MTPAPPECLTGCVSWSVPEPGPACQQPRGAGPHTPGVILQLLPFAGAHMPLSLALTPPRRSSLLRAGSSAAVGPPGPLSASLVCSSLTLVTGLPGQRGGAGGSVRSPLDTQAVKARSPTGTQGARTVEIEPHRHPVWQHRQGHNSIVSAASVQATLSYVSVQTSTHKTIDTWTGAHRVDVCKALMDTPQRPVLGVFSQDTHDSSARACQDPQI